MIKFFFLTMNILTFYLFNFFFEKSTPNIFKQKWANFSRGRRKIMNVRTLRRALCAKGLAETTTTSAGFSTAAMALKSKCTFLKFPILSPGSKISDPKKVNFEIFYLAASSNFSHVLRMLMMYVPGKMFNEF